MTSPEILYAELKGDIAALADPLFDLSEKLLHNQDNFLPHGAVLTGENEVKLVAATNGKDVATSVEVLPILHDGLRQQARELELKAIGVAENVTVTLEGQRPSKAVKVLVEHKRGLTVALYLPFEKKLLRGYVTGPTFSKLATPEVNAWPGTAV
jgi:hypothetical protein